MKRIILIVLMSLMLVGCIGVEEETPSTNTYGMILLSGERVSVQAHVCKPYSFETSVHVNCWDNDDNLHVYITSEFWEEKSEALLGE